MEHEQRIALCLIERRLIELQSEMSDLEDKRNLILKEANYAERCRHKSGTD